MYVLIQYNTIVRITMKCKTAPLPQCSLISGYTVSENRDLDDGTHKDAAQEQRQTITTSTTNAQID